MGFKSSTNYASYFPEKIAAVGQLKDALPGLRKLLAIESPLKIIKKWFLFHLKSSFGFHNI